MNTETANSTTGMLGHVNCKEDYVATEHNYQHPVVCTKANL